MPRSASGFARLLLAPLLLAVADGASAGEMQPRREMVVPAADSLPDGPCRLVVKFRDALRVRASAGGLASDAGADLGAMPAAAARLGATFVPLIDLPAETLAAIQRRAAAMSGSAQPDLAGLMRVVGPEEVLAALVPLLRADPAVEFVSCETPPGLPGSCCEAPCGEGCQDICPVTPDLTGSQLHFGELGMRMADAWSLTALAKGGGIRVADVEFDFAPTHEDLCGIVYPADHVFTMSGYSDHGNAVLGIMVGAENDYGIDGLVPDADAYFWGEGAVASIAEAMAIFEPGDVINIDIETGDGEPLEVQPSVFMITKVATDSGVTVVAAAGNGDRNLDAAAYQFYRDWGDSGAIIVGAGNPGPDVVPGEVPARSKTGYSTYGSRVNLQGWGDAIWTTGYWAPMPGDDPNQRYRTFGGTSGATPMVASAAASVQAMVADPAGGCGAPLSPRQVRALLVATGQPQQGDPPLEHIGPLPDLLAAAGRIGYGAPADDCDGDGTPDLCQLIQNPALDCDGNCIIDSCEGLPDADADGIADACDNCPLRPNHAQADCDGDGAGDACDGIEQDCDGDGVPDACEVVHFVHATSPQLTPIGSGQARTFTIPAAPPASTDVVMTFAARADIDSTNQFLVISINGAIVGAVFDGPGLTDCADPPETDVLVIGAGVFNAALFFQPDAVILISADSSPGGQGFMNPQLCSPRTYVTIDVAYRSFTDLVSDQNCNGTPDGCECLTDLDADGVTGPADLMLVLEGWGACEPCAADMDCDGEVGFRELLRVLAGWGGCG